MVKMVVCICPQSEDYDETIVSVASSQDVVATCTYSQHTAMFSAMFVLVGAGEAGCFREVAALERWLL